MSGAVGLGAPDIPLLEPGTRVTANGSELVVSFDDALFQRGTRLASGARQRLLALGSRLEPYGTSISIVVVGYTDALPVPPGRRYRDNAALALARASVVVDVLREGGSLPPQVFSLRAFGPAGGTERGPQARRTAEIWITPARSYESAP